MEKQTEKIKELENRLSYLENGVDKNFDSEAVQNVHISLSEIFSAENYNSDEK